MWMLTLMEGRLTCYLDVPGSAAKFRQLENVAQFSPPSQGVCSKAEIQLLHDLASVPFSTLLRIRNILQNVDRPMWR
jgi:hypothetical protein